jgi:hypothetical protein
VTLLWLKAFTPACVGRDYTPGLTGPEIAVDSDQTRARLAMNRHSKSRPHTSHRTKLKAFTADSLAITLIAACAHL